MISQMEAVTQISQAILRLRTSDKHKPSKAAIAKAVASCATLLPETSEPARLAAHLELLRRYGK